MPNDRHFLNLAGMVNLQRARWRSFHISTGRGFAGFSRPSAIPKCHRPHFCGKIAPVGHHFICPPGAAAKSTWIFR